MKKLKDFQAIRDHFTDREIDDLQAAADARRARLGAADRNATPGAGQPAHGGGGGPTRRLA